MAILISRASLFVGIHRKSNNKLKANHVQQPRTGEAENRESRHFKHLQFNFIMENVLVKQTSYDGETWISMQLGQTHLFQPTNAELEKMPSMKGKWFKSGGDQYLEDKKEEIQISISEIEASGCKNVWAKA